MAIFDGKSLEIYWTVVKQLCTNCTQDKLFSLRQELDLTIVQFMLQAI